MHFYTKLPATLISKAFLDEERRSLPPLWFASEYLCEFVDTIDQVFGYEDVMRAVSPTVQPLFPEGTCPLTS